MYVLHDAKLQESFSSASYRPASTVAVGVFSHDFTLSTAKIE